MNANYQQCLDSLLELSHELGREDRKMAILGEGNTSARLNSETFLVKASGGNLAALQPENVVECRFEPLLALLEKSSESSDEEIEATLLASRVDSNAKKPSVEALFHAFLLSLPNIHFVGHTHSLCVNQVLCSPRAGDFANKRLFPDEIVCCGETSVYVPYPDPGLRLAQSIRGESQKYLEKNAQTPRVILLKNHGIITMGSTVPAVMAAALMAEKAAAIFAGAAVLGGPDFLNEPDVKRISNRLDEHYRRKALNI